MTENISVQGILFYLSQVYNQDRYLAWLIELLRACKGAYEMKDEARTKEQLISELAELRQRIAELETLKTRHKQTEERAQHLNLVLRAVRNVNQLIVREKDRSRLLQGICKNIVETPTYHDAWVALLDERGRLLTYAKAGLGNDFLPMAERLKHGELPACGQRALRQSEVVVTKDPFSTCTDCPLAKKYEGRAAMTVRLEYGGRVYGLLSVSVPAAFITGVEEQSLFREVAGDISFALRSMELEEERKRIASALQESDERIHTIVSNAPIVLWSLDKEGVFTLSEGAGLNALGLRPGEIVGQSIYDVYRDVPQILEDNRRALAGDTFVSITEVGNLVFESHYSPIRDKDGEVIGMVGVSTDITERKQAEEALRQSEEKYRTILKSIEDGYYEVDLAGNFTFFNDAHCRQLGYPREEMMWE